MYMMDGRCSSHALFKAGGRGARRNTRTLAVVPYSRKRLSRILWGTWGTRWGSMHAENQCQRRRAHHPVVRLH